MMCTSFHASANANANASAKEWADRKALELCLMTSHRMSEGDQDECEAYLDDLQFESDAQGFIQTNLEDDFYSSNPCEPVIGCFIHREGKAMHWNWDEQRYEVFTPESKINWPFDRMQFTPPTLNDTTYLRHIDDVVDLKAVDGPAERPTEAVDAVPTLYYVEQEAVSEDLEPAVGPWQCLSDAVDALPPLPSEDVAHYRRTLRTQGVVDALPSVEQDQVSDDEQSVSSSADSGTSTVSGTSSKSSWSSIASEGQSTGPAPRPVAPPQPKRRTPTNTHALVEKKFVVEVTEALEIQWGYVIGPGGSNLKKIAAELQESERQDLKIRINDTRAYSGIVVVSQRESYSPLIPGVLLKEISRRIYAYL